VDSNIIIRFNILSKKNKKIYNNNGFDKIKE